jgi:hypothetical protein
MAKSLYEYCCEQGREELLAQWHPEKNGPLTPKDVAHGSRKKAWWRCEKGHEWQAEIYSRTLKQRGCTVCAGQRVVVGDNDLATVSPDIADEWHPEKNGDLTPQMVTAGSNKTVWWICNKGHEYQMMIGHRTGKDRGCPYCAGRKVLAGFNDLATKFPMIAAEWHPTLNGDLTPQMVTIGSNKKVWWQCVEGHVWKAAIYSRTGKGKCGCPVCAGVVKKKT